MADPFLAFGAPNDLSPGSLNDVKLTWTLESSPIGPSRVVSVSTDIDAVSAEATFVDIGSPRDITGGLELVIDLLGAAGLSEATSFLSGEIRARLLRRDR